MQTERVMLAAAALAVVAVAVAGIAAMNAQPDDAGALARRGPVPVPQPGSAAPEPSLTSRAGSDIPQADRTAGSVPPTEPSTARPTASLPPDRPLSGPAIQLQRYSGLASSGSAADQHAAYRMLSSCLEPQRTLAFVEQVHRFEVDPALRAQLLQMADTNAFDCAHLPHADAQVRLGLLHKAIAGGVREGWSDWFIEGPGGNPMDLIHRPDDPRVQEWVRASTSAVAALARQGDVASAQLLASFHGMGPPAFADAEKAALYEALGLALRQRSTSLPEAERATWARIVDNALQRLSADRAAAVQREVAAILAGL